MQIGSLGVASTRTGGAGLRDEIYSWPSTNRCRIDQELVEGNFDVAPEERALGSELVNVRGLDALEDLLFYRGAESRCAPQIEIVADGRWAGIQAELELRRDLYAAHVVARLSVDVTRLIDAWGAFRPSLVDASAYGSQRAARDEVFAALFYLDLQTKDAKLAIPGASRRSVRRSIAPTRSSRCCRATRSPTSRQTCAARA